MNETSSAPSMKALYAFLDELAANNDRTWFAANKARYDLLRAWWIEQVQKLINEMARFDSSLVHVEAKDCLYRIYRDTRFSPDKTPYKTYFSALISPTGRQCERACYYFHQGVDESALYSGVWCPPAPMLKKLRKAIIDNVDEFRSIVETPEVEKHFPGWYGHQLKTAPKGYDRNHPDIDLLRLTEYGKGCQLPRSFFEKEGWQKKAASLYALLKPMNDFLNYSIDE
ncbi:MAG: DUF2461 domain-containing protein [Muribaculaceae bacterium]|nr:DUF2461 domain-containing protein [Muribaculaceae bacterium]